MTKTSLGLDENIECALCYVLGFVTGIIFFIMEKDNKIVKFHAMQSIITFLLVFVISWILPAMFYASSSYVMIGMVSSLISLAGFILWLILIMKAYQGEMFKLPIIGDIAETQANKI